MNRREFIAGSVAVGVGVGCVGVAQGRTVTLPKLGPSASYSTAMVRSMGHNAEHGRFLKDVDHNDGDMVIALDSNIAYQMHKGRWLPVG